MFTDNESAYQQNSSAFTSFPQTILARIMSFWDGQQQFQLRSTSKSFLSASQELKKWHFRLLEIDFPFYKTLEHLNSNMLSYNDAFAYTFGSCIPKPMERTIKAIFAGRIEDIPKKITGFEIIPCRPQMLTDINPTLITHYNETRVTATLVETKDWCIDSLPLFILALLTDPTVFIHFWNRWTPEQKTASASKVFTIAAFKNHVEILALALPELKDQKAKLVNSLFTSHKLLDFLVAHGYIETYHKIWDYAKEIGIDLQALEIYSAPDTYYCHYIKQKFEIAAKHGISRFTQYFWEHLPFEKIIDVSFLKDLIEATYLHPEILAWLMMQISQLSDELLQNILEDIMFPYPGKYLSPSSVVAYLDPVVPIQTWQILWDHADVHTKKKYFEKFPLPDLFITTHQELEFFEKIRAEMKSLFPEESKAQDEHNPTYERNIQARIENIKNYLADPEALRRYPLNARLLAKIFSMMTAEEKNVVKHVEIDIQYEFAYSIMEIELVDFATGFELLTTIDLPSAILYHVIRDCSIDELKSCYEILKKEDFLNIDFKQKHWEALFSVLIALGKLENLQFFVTIYPESLSPDCIIYAFTKTEVHCLADCNNPALTKTIQWYWSQLPSEVQLAFLSKGLENDTDENNQELLAEDLHSFWGIHDYLTSIIIRDQSSISLEAHRDYDIFLNFRPMTAAALFIYAIIFGYKDLAGWLFDTYYAHPQLCITLVEKIDEQIVAAAARHGEHMLSWLLDKVLKPYGKEDLFLSHISELCILAGSNNQLYTLDWLYNCGFEPAILFENIRQRISPQSTFYSELTTFKNYQHLSAFDNWFVEKSLQQLRDLVTRIINTSEITNEIQSQLNSSNLALVNAIFDHQFIDVYNHFKFNLPTRGQLTLAEIVNTLDTHDAKPSKRFRVS